MTDQKRYFFCGIGGSGMLPLALILRAQGADVAGSDRSRDQGRTPDKFSWLQSQGLALFAQDGTGLFSPEQILVASAAIEDSVPDIAAARALGCRRLSRAELLSELFNAATRSIGVAGTSGKSTTTAMIAHILSATRRKPTVMNGAVMKNFLTPSHPFASALVGDGELFVTEIDESDGTIELYQPEVAVLNNVSVDHKSMDELRTLFGDFLARSDVAVLNGDDSEVMDLRSRARAVLDYGLTGTARFAAASDLTPEPTAISFRLNADTFSGRVRLQVPGRHNVSNALAAICAACAVGVPLAEAAGAVEGYSGLKRRFEIVGEADGVTVIDDFGHNPDKIAATLRTLHDFPGRLLVMFQPHGYGPLRKMRREFADAFIGHLAPEDQLVMPQPAYFGGTVDRSVSSTDLAADVRAEGREALALETRAECGAKLVEWARSGDRILVMGARDDTLSEFAESLLQELRKRAD